MSANTYSKYLFLSLIIPLLLTAICIITAVTAFFIYTSPANPANPAEQVFVVSRGESITSIGQRLQNQGLIKSATAFKIIVKINKLGNQIQAGDFRLSPSQNTKQIATGLTRGSIDIWVTLLEGWRREEMAEALEAALGSGGSFSQQDFLNLTATKEGFLFPETYLIPRNADANQVVAILTTTFNQQTSNLTSQITSSNRTLESIVTMASIVEREARGSARPIVAGILWKRLDNDWPLQVDATLQYIKGYSSQEKTWWPTPYANDKQLTSSYNTYLHLGLPPAPIANPSLDSIKATVSPTASDYWYYISDLEGNMHYAQTIQEHNANVNRYLR